MAAGALEGIRVIDVTQVWAGPLVTRIMGDFGAEVIKVESIQRPDIVRYEHRPKYPPNDKTYNQGGYFHQLNRNKYGITLDLSRSKGRELLLQLVEYADVVVENYASRVFDNFGLCYERFAASKPDVIMLSLQGYGDSGPYRNGSAFGSTIEAMSGFKSLLGYGNGVPIYTGACIADPSSALYGLFAVINALFYRQKTGKGQHINVSMHEAMSSITEEALLEYGIHRREPQQWGSRHPYFAPYGSYRCRGDDSWIAISVTSDQEWNSLCEIIDNPQLRSDCFSTITQRQQNRDALDRLVEEWTLRHYPGEAMEILQQAGVPAGAFYNGKDILDNLHLKARDYFWDVACPDTGTYPQVGPIMRFSETPATLRLSPPSLGEHNEYILGSILGMSKDDITALQQEGIIGNEPRYQG